MRFIGSKGSLLDFIEGAVNSFGLCGGSFCDLFAGTTTVGRHFKRLGYSVVSNDLLALSYVFGRAYIETCVPPSFDRLYPGAPDGLPRAVDELNGLGPEHGFIWSHYSPGEGAGAQRMYFTPENAGRIDAVRGRIEAWHRDGVLEDGGYYVLLAALLEAIPGVSNTSGTYGAFLKHWDPRARKSLTLKVPQIATSRRVHRVCREDGEHLAARLETDILYLDPPYNTRQYMPNYHILETVARWDNPIVSGVTGLRHGADGKSRFCNRETALAALGAIAENSSCRLLLLSYNSEGLMPDEAIRETLGARGKVTVLERPYRRYRSHRRESPATVIERLYAVPV